jgi:hypothetical protein
MHPSVATTHAMPVAAPVAPAAAYPTALSAAHNDGAPSEMLREIAAKASRFQGATSS